MLWHMPVIPKVMKLSQEAVSKFKASPGYRMRLCLQTIKSKFVGWGEIFVSKVLAGHT